MRRGLLAGIVGGVVAVACVAAVVFYLMAVPGMLATGYKERAEPEHDRVEKLLRPARDTFSRETFGFDNREIEKADKPGEYVRAVERATGRALKRHNKARGTVKRTAARLAKVDAGEMTEAPDWPLLGGRGELSDAESIASDESDYVRKAERFLRDYERLLEYEIDVLRFYRRVGITMGRGGDSIPDNPTSPGQITRPINRSVSDIQGQVRRFKKLKPPPERKDEHRNFVGAINFVVSELRRFSSAIGRLDIASANQIDRRLARGSKRYDRRSRANFRRLLARSIYVRQINDLEKRERDISRAYKKL